MLEKGQTRGAMVIPAYEEVERLPRFLSELREVGFLHHPGWQTHVVDDGSSESSATALRRRLSELGLEDGKDYGWTRLPANRGKGGAVYAGWDRFADNCDVLAFVDADGAVPAYEVMRLTEQVQQMPDTALFASRIKMLGKKVERSGRRHFSGRIFASLVGSMIYSGIYDSQCGLKFIPAAEFRKLRQLLTEERFAFDVELLAALVHLGTPMIEVPIDWIDVPGSKVSLVRDAIRMAATVKAIFKRMKSWGIG